MHACINFGYTIVQWFNCVQLKKLSWKIIETKFWTRFYSYQCLKQVRDHDIASKFLPNGSEIFKNLWFDVANLVQSLLCLWIHQSYNRAILCNWGILFCVKMYFIECRSLCILANLVLEYHVIQGTILLSPHCLFHPNNSENISWSFHHTLSIPFIFSRLKVSKLHNLPQRLIFLRLLHSDRRWHRTYWWRHCIAPMGNVSIELIGVFYNRPAFWSTYGNRLYFWGDYRKNVERKTLYDSACC